MKALLPLYGLNVVENNDFDILLHVGPHFYDGVETSSGKKNVIVVHDIIPELLWSDISVREERCRALRCAHSVIAVSEWTKNDLIREYDVEPEKVHVIHHGPGGVVHDQNICTDRLSVPF